MKYWNEDFKNSLRDWGDNLSAHLHIGGKETQPAHIRTSGDEKKARQLAATLGRKLLAEAKMRVMAQGLATALRELSLVDGSKIRVQSQLGADGFPDHDSIKVHVPTGGKEKQRRCIGYIVQTFNDNPHGDGPLPFNDYPSRVRLLTPSGLTMDSYANYVDEWTEDNLGRLPFTGYPDNGAKYLWSRDPDNWEIFNYDYQGVVVADFTLNDLVTGVPRTYTVESDAPREITNPNWAYVTASAHSEGMCGNSGCDWYWENSDKYWTETAEPCNKDFVAYPIVNLYQYEGTPPTFTAPDKANLAYYTGPHRLSMPIQCFMDWAVGCYRADRGGVDSEGDIATPDTGPYGQTPADIYGASQPNPDMDADKAAALNEASQFALAWYLSIQDDYSYRTYELDLYKELSHGYHRIPYILKRTDGKGGFHSLSGFHWDKGDIVFTPRQTNKYGEASFFMLPMGEHRMLRYSDEVVANTIQNWSWESHWTEGGATWSGACYFSTITQTDNNMTQNQDGHTLVTGNFAIPNKVEEGVHSVTLFRGSEDRVKVHLLILDDNKSLYFEYVIKDFGTAYQNEMKLKIKVGVFKDIGELVKVVE